MYDSEQDEGEQPGIRITVIGDDKPKRIDLSAMTTEAMIEQQCRDDARRKGVPRKHYDRHWQPQHKKGEPIDKDSDAYQAAAQAAVRGLPLVSTMHWLEVQMFDNGPSAGRHAHTQYVLKFTGSSAAAGALISEDRRALSVTRHCFLATKKNFIRNLKRKKEKHALLPTCWATVERILVLAEDPLVEGQPEPLYGSLTMKMHGEGTVRSLGQFAGVQWVMNEGEWRPIIALVQYCHRTKVEDHAGLLLGLPPVIKPGRKATACRWYGRLESEEFTRLMERAKDRDADLREKLARMRRPAA